VRGGGDHVGEREGRGHDARGDEARDVRHVGHHVGTDLKNGLGDSIKWAIV